VKDDILKILLKVKGEYISGEAISTTLGVSRTAVWKYINQLRKEGYTIKSVSNKGYCLSYIPNRLNKVLLQYFLKTISIGRVIELHDSIGSTNMRARELAHEGALHGTLVIANEQTQGKGRMGRVWISPPETGIWMSLVLRPSLSPQDAHRITVIAALSVSNAINIITGLKAEIKWPNDIIIGSKKVCGILTEIQTEPDIIEYVVLGIGINVNAKRDDFPEELAHSATSLYIESEKTSLYIESEKTSLSIGSEKVIDRNALIVEILKSFESLYDHYEKTGDFTDILDTYKGRCVTLNKRVKVFGRVDEFEGTAIDLSNDCALLVKLDNGIVKRIISGDVSVRGIAGYI